MIAAKQRGRLITAHDEDKKLVNGLMISSRQHRKSLSVQVGLLV